MVLPGTDIHMPGSDSDLIVGGNITSATAGVGQLHQNNQFQPFDSGMSAWSYDPIHIRNTKLAVNGTLYLVKLWLRQKSVNILNIFWAVTTPGSGPVAGQNWAGLYSSTGVLLGSSNIDAKVTGAAGLVEGNVGPVPGGLSVPGLPNFVRAAFLFNAATPPTLGCATTTLGFSNIGLEAFAPRYCTGGTGLTTLPATLGALTASADALFASITLL